MKIGKAILAFVVMISSVGILASCGKNAFSFGQTTKLVASSQKTPQAWVSTYGLKNNDPVSFVFVFNGNKVATYDFPLGAKLSDFKKLSNRQLISKAAEMNKKQSKKLIAHEKNLVFHQKSSQWAAAEQQAKDLKNIVNSWTFKEPTFIKYDMKKTGNPEKEQLKITAKGSDFERFSINSSLDDLNGEYGSLSKNVWQQDWRFELVKTVKTDNWSGYKIISLNDENFGTDLVQPGKHNVGFDE